MKNATKIEEEPSIEYQPGKAERRVVGGGISLILGGFIVSIFNHELGSLIIAGGGGLAVGGLIVGFANRGENES